jgi:UDP-hydrolysing UDP-N-acetyl-D-glucosamine 2-epimerase
MPKRKIAIYTGNRAEYGLFVPVIKAISIHPDLEYFLLVSGAHLQEDFGYTAGEIKKDGFTIYREIKLSMGEDSVYATARAIGSGILSLSDALRDLKPDMLLVYADRFEGFSAVIAGTQMNVPTAHIEGGDITEGGALDDSVRHAMTKLSHLHFTTNEEAAERIRKMGEEPWRVFNVGFPVLDLIMQGSFAKPEELESKYNLRRDRPLVLFTQHSVTTEYEDAAQQLQPSLKAVRRLAQEGYQFILTFPNNDAGGKSIIKEMEEFMQGKVPNVQCHSSLGRYNYHGILNYCAKVTNGVCAGNSSSGIKETPIFGCPTVNIGSRQQGRLRAENVIDAPYNEEAIIQAIVRCATDAQCRQSAKNCRNPYGIGNAGARIAQTLATIPLDRKLLQKKMTY